MFSDFCGVCFDQIYNQAAKLRFMYGEQGATPLVIRTMIGAGIGCGPQHSQSPYSIFANIPGLKVVTPSNPYDAKGLLISAIRDNDPVMFCEHKSLLGMEGEVPDDSYEVPLGKGKIIKEGNDITIIGLALMAQRSKKAAEILKEKHNIKAKVIDLRTLVPLDLQTIKKSINETGLAMTVEENPRLCGWGAEISSLITEHCFSN